MDPVWPPGMNHQAVGKNEITLRHRNYSELAEQNAFFISEYESRGITVTVSAGLALTIMKVPLIRTH